MTESTGIEKALFVPQTGKMKGQEIAVHFNPASLQYAITNTLKEGRNKKQYVNQSTAKLTMDLIFDTTHNGEDVRIYTTKLAHFMEPEKKIPAIVRFEWGTYSFQGMVEAYKETLDFFAPNGVPLRSSLNLTLANQDKVFEDPDTSSSFDTQASLDPLGVEVPRTPGQDVTATATQAGDPRAARGIASTNNQESMRFTTGPSLVVDASIDLGGPAAFASGGASLDLGIGIDLGAGLDVGAEVGLGADVAAAAGISASVGAATGPVIGGSASAGVSATAGAFAGLRAGAAGPSRSSKLDPELLIEASPSLGLATDRGASFELGGKATIEGPTSLCADVGASASLASRIRFEEG